MEALKVAISQRVGYAQHRAAITDPLAHRPNAEHSFEAHILPPEPQGLTPPKLGGKRNCI